jgi:hypothetical protein
VVLLAAVVMVRFPGKGNAEQVSKFFSASAEWLITVTFSQDKPIFGQFCRLFMRIPPPASAMDAVTPRAFSPSRDWLTPVPQTHGSRSSPTPDNALS